MSRPFMYHFNTDALAKSSTDISNEEPNQTVLPGMFVAFDRFKTNTIRTLVRQNCRGGKLVSTVTLTRDIGLHVNIAFFEDIN